MIKNMFAAHCDEMRDMALYPKFSTSTSSKLTL
jgi:hypothetical protein